MPVPGLIAFPPPAVRHNEPDPSALGDPEAINEPTTEVTEEVRSNRPVSACRPVEDVASALLFVSAHSPILTRSRPQDDGAHLGSSGRGDKVRACRPLEVLCSSRSTPGR